MNYGDHRWCGELTPDGNFCRLHRRNNVQRAARHDQQQRRIRIIRLAREELTVQHGHLPWRDVITPLFHQPDPLQINYEVGLQYYLLFVDREPYGFRLFWHWLAQGAAGNQPDIAPPRHGLAALARDAQNVHTAPVSAQTNAGVDMLLAAVVPTDQQTEKRMMFIILTLIIAVAAFNLVSTLVMTVTDKQADIAILRTLGASPVSIMKIFMVQGALVGLIGTAIGVASGVLISLNVDVIVPFIESLFGVQFLPRDIYLISALPSDLRWPDVWRIGGLAIVLAFLATLYPAFKAASTDPVQVLRYE